MKRFVCETLGEPVVEVGKVLLAVGFLLLVVVAAGLCLLITIPIWLPIWAAYGFKTPQSFGVLLSKEKIRAIGFWFPGARKIYWADHGK